jgi:hypothetical protein
MYIHLKLSLPRYNAHAHNRDESDDIYNTQAYSSYSLNVAAVYKSIYWYITYNDSAILQSRDSIPLICSGQSQTYVLYKNIYLFIYLLCVML